MQLPGPARSAHCSPCTAPPHLHAVLPRQLLQQLHGGQLVEGGIGLRSAWRVAGGSGLAALPAAVLPAATLLRGHLTRGRTSAPPHTHAPQILAPTRTRHTQAHQARGRAAQQGGTPVQAANRRHPPAAAPQTPALAPRQGPRPKRAPAPLRARTEAPHHPVESQPQPLCPRAPCCTVPRCGSAHPHARTRCMRAHTQPTRGPVQRLHCQRGLVLGPDVLRRDHLQRE